MDDPLFDASEFDVDVDPEVVETVASWSPDPDDVDRDDVYDGDRVHWVGTQGRMMRFDWDAVSASPGNPFDPEKVAAFRDLIRSGDRPLLFAPPAKLMRVSLDDVRDTQEAVLREELFESHGMSRPFTSGDDELDEFLADPEAYIEMYADEDDAEGEETLRVDMGLRAEEAIDEQTGDLGKLVAYLRDGNHRAFAAQLAGESDVWLTIRMEQPEKDMQFLGLREEDFE